MKDNLLKRLDYRKLEYTVRDISFLTCSIFTDTHLISFKKIFGFKKFSFIFWYQESKGQITFYRDGSRYNLMAKIIANQYLKDISIARKTAKRLIDISDELNAFIAKHRSLSSLTKEWEYFYKTYRDFFAYHQAMYWPAEYLSKVKYNSDKKIIINRIISILNKAYKYNETVIPGIEYYFAKLGIRHLSYSEIDEDLLKNIRAKSKCRSIALVDDKIYIMSYTKATYIDKKIKAGYGKNVGKKSISGYTAYTGKTRGKVRLVTNLSKLKECRQGDILVTTMTRPQYNMVIKKVSAIITDEGGILCHASIISRELKKPCIIGTKIATKVLKDGDMVEVDADNGIIRKI